MESVITIVIPIYIVFAGFMFVAIKPLIEEGLKADNVPEPFRHTAPILITLCTFMWPLVLFGIGCGWGVRRFWEHHRSKVCVMMDTLLEKSGAKPVAYDEWQDFFTHNIKRIPRRKLLMLNAVGWSNCNLDEDKLKKIVSSELADRDLFEIKY